MINVVIAGYARSAFAPAKKGSLARLRHAGVRAVRSSGRGKDAGGGPSQAQHQHGRSENH